MDSETKNAGPLTLLRAGDWVALRSKPRSRFYLAPKLGGVALRAVWKGKTVYLTEEQFSSGEWIVLEPNIHPNAAVVGAYNKPEGK